MKIQNLVSRRGKEWEIKNTVEDVLSAIKKYDRNEPMAYKCPRLNGCLNPMLLLFLTFVLKVLYGLSFTKITTDFDFHRHWQEVPINLPP